jgi:hypothetical protein
MNFHKFMYSYEFKNDEKHKELVYTTVFNASELNFVQNLCRMIFIS